MSVLPILPRGFVVGRILTSRGDGPDADKFPDTAVVVGMVDFTPATAYRKLDSATVVTHSKITAKLDSHGDLHPQREMSDNTGSDAEDGIWLPVGTWAVAYRLNTGFGALPGHNIDVTEAHTEADPLPLFANMGDAPQPGASYVTMQVPLNGQPGHYLVLNGEGSGLAWASGVLPETISTAVEDYLVANPPAATPDATTSVKGVVQLAGDLGGTAASPTVPGLADKANTSDLGGAALLDVGTTAGTVAAGDHNHTGVYAPALEADDNYVTDAEKVKLANLSGTNTGDQDLSGYLTTSAAPELIRDTMGTALVAGANVTITPDDAGDTITIAAEGGGGATEKKYPVVSGMSTQFQSNTDQSGTGWSGSFHPYNYAGPIVYVYCTVATADSAGTLEVAVYDTEPATGMPTTLLVPVVSIPMTTTGDKQIAVGEVPTGAGVWIFARMVGATTGQVRGNNNNVSSFGWPLVRFGWDTAPISPSGIVENPAVGGNIHGHEWNPSFGFAW